MKQTVLIFSLCFISSILLSQDPHFQENNHIFVGSYSSSDQWQGQSGWERAENMLRHRPQIYDELEMQQIVSITPEQQEIIHFIKNNNPTILELFQKCKQYGSNPDVKRVYDLCVHQAFHKVEIQQKLQRDILWDQYSAEQKKDPDLQSLFLLRFDYEQMLENTVAPGQHISQEYKRFLYEVIGYLDVRNIEDNFNKNIANAFINEATYNIEKYDQSVRSQLVHPSGVLRAFEEYSLAEKFLSGRYISDPDTRFAVNFALHEIDKGNDKKSCAALEMLRYAHQSLECVDQNFAQFCKDRVFESYKEIVMSNTESFTPSLIAHYVEAFNRLEIDPIFEERVQAYDQSKQEGYKEYREVHTLTPQVKGFMIAQNINIGLFQDIQGNRLQHHMTDELIQIMHNSVEYGHKHNLLSNLGDFLDLAQNYNHAKELQNAVISTDICWNIFEYGKAIVDGCGDTVEGIIDLIAHPVTHLTEMAKNMAMLTKNVSMYLFDSVFDPQKAIATENHLTELFYVLMDRFKEMSGPQRVRLATHLITDHLCTGKALATIGKAVCVGGKFAYEASKDTVQFIKRLPKTKMLAQTSAGEMMMHFYESTQESIKKGRMLVESVWRQFLKKMLPSTLKIEAEIAELTREFGKMTTKLFGGVEIEFDIKFIHIFMPEEPTKIKNSRIRGWHHDHNSYFEKYGQLMFGESEYKQGCRLTKAGWKGGKLSTKTFFPKNWSRRKVAKKIREALKNIKLETNPINGKLQGVGKTLEGIEIRFNLDRVGNKIKVTSAFPCQKWLKS